MQILKVNSVGSLTLHFFFLRNHQMSSYLQQWTTDAMSPFEHIEQYTQNNNNNKKWQRISLDSHHVCCVCIWNGEVDAPTARCINHSACGDKKIQIDSRFKIIGRRADLHGDRSLYALSRQRTCSSLGFGSCPHGAHSYLCILYFV